MARPSSITSSVTSNTLTHTPGMAFLSTFTDSSKPAGAAEMLVLFESIQAGNRHAFLQPTPAISNASLQLAKATLDAYAGQVSDEQQQRQKEANKKRKRAEHPLSKNEVLKIRRLHIDGFENGQVWQQARRIITSTLQDTKEALQDLEDRKEVKANGVNGDVRSLRSRDAHSEIGSDDSEALAEELLDSEEDLDEDEGASIDEEEDDDEDLEELLEDDFEEGAEDIEQEDDEGIEEDEDEDEEDEPSGTMVQDPNGLNDGFFSIDDFNKQTQWFEEQDAKANPDADQASDDEEIDWHTDPLSSKLSAKGKSSKKSNKEEDDELSSDLEDDEDEGRGPTFGNMDLDAPEGESDLDEAEDDVDAGDGSNANDIFYENFFAPPKRKGPNKGKGKPRKPKEPRSAAPADQDIDRAMKDVHRDLFEDESEREDSDDALSDVSTGDPKSRKSAHERRQAKLAEEIRKLEAANVAKREWALAGEAKAVDRPMNSLLEEDLDFEHVGKPVPVITTEVSESIEEIIKRRILAQEFDEVIRRRPDSADLSGNNTRRGLVDLEDTKAKQSLAELYEEEHVKTANPDTYVSKSEEKVRKDEKEVEHLWRDVCAKLDALSSWHYRPKPAAPSLTVVSDVATVSMEDAQPATAQGVTGGDTALAPQEIYAPGRETAEEGEVVVAKSGLPLARQEMSREERSRRRRRQKERIRKAGGVGVNGKTATNGVADADGKTKTKTRAQEQRDTLGDLKKGGVKVINKKGEIVDMEGNKAKAAKAASSGSFKL